MEYGTVLENNCEEIENERKKPLHKTDLQELWNMKYETWNMKYETWNM